jgi:hypothetical protein
VSRTLVGFALLLSLACAGSNESRERPPQYALVGDWVEVYPATRRGNRLTLRADSSAAGNFTDPDEPRFAALVRRWRIGAEFMPNGLCLGYEDYYSCQSWRVAGDTLWLANLGGTVFVRANAYREEQEYQFDRDLRAPVPGDSVRTSP